jgi:fimbrial chaperone protein
MQRMRFLVLLASQLAFASLLATSARAAKFDVAPISLSLSAKTTSGTLALTNRSKEPLRFHISAFAWNQNTDGEMQLQPTTDIVFFPAMLTLNPNESRQIRVGTKIKPGAIERSYRLFVEELPPLSKTQEEEANSVRVLTKMGLPIFIEAQAPKAAPSVTPLVLKGRQVTFSVKNSGSAHMRVQKVMLTAKSAAKTVHSEELPAWYVLAGGTRTYAVTLPEAACKEATSLEVKMESDSGSPKASLAKFSCGP